MDPQQHITPTTCSKQTDRQATVRRSLLTTRTIAVVSRCGDLLNCRSLTFLYIEIAKKIYTNVLESRHDRVNLLFLGGSVSTVSWEHFFLSLNQYYQSLRQEAPIKSDMAHVYRHHVRGITAQEVEGLVAWLRLTRTVAEHDEGEQTLCLQSSFVVKLILKMKRVCVCVFLFSRLEKH